MTDGHVKKSNDLLQEKLSSHIYSTNQRFSVVDEKVNALDAEVKSLVSSTSRLIESQDRLSETQKECTTALTLLTTETRDVVNLYKTASGAVTAANGIQKVFIWVVKWPLLLAGVVSIVNWVSKNSGIN